MNHNGSKEHEAALRAAISLIIPLDEALAQLERFVPDAERPLLVLRRADLISVLRRFESGALTANDLYRWADAMEARGDMGMEQDHASVLESIIFELATPELYGPVDEGRVRTYVKRLGDE